MVSIIRTFSEHYPLDPNGGGSGSPAVISAAPSLFCVKV